MKKEQRREGVIMKKLDELLSRLAIERPVDWDNLPDIDLYRDQVLGYMKRQHSLQPDSAQLTGAMINNYIKSGLLPRANGKKYEKDHLVYLTAICTLKQILSVNETDELLKRQPNIARPEEFYGDYVSYLDSSLLETMEILDPIDSKDELAVAVLKLTIPRHGHTHISE